MKQKDRGGGQSFTKSNEDANPGRTCLYLTVATITVVQAAYVIESGHTLTALLRTLGYNYIETLLSERLLPRDWAASGC